MEEAEEQNAVFLNEGDILPWEQPLAKNEISTLPMYNGSTEILKAVGMEEFTRGIEKYHPSQPNEHFLVVASAAKYLARIGRLPKDGKLKGELKALPVRKEVLFKGHISIYGEGEIPGTKVNGYYLIKMGDIWAARLDVDLFSGSKALEELLFEKRDKAERVEAIVRGYEIQERRRAERRELARHESFLEGTRTGEWNGHGPHSGAC